MKRIFLKSLLLFAVALSLTSACSNTESEKNESTSWCILLDITGVRQSPEIREQYAGVIRKVIDKAGPGDALVIAYISESSINEINFLLNQRFAVFSGNSDNELLLKGQRKKFMENLNNEKNALKEKITDYVLHDERMAGNTDIFSALHLAANVFKNYNDPHKKLIILSDMMQFTPEYDFYTSDLSPENIDRIIEKEKSGPAGLPDLSAAEVFIIGALNRNSDEFFKVKNFWTAYLKASNARLSEENYGANLISL